MRVGVALGNVGLTRRPLTATDHADQVIQLAEAAEQLGFHAVWVGDHLAFPTTPTTSYPYGGGTMSPQTSMLDPFAVLAAVAARTSRVRLGFGVVVLPLRHPVVVAKLVATIDALSHGRVVLGVGTGWLPEELTLVGVDVAERGRATDAALQLLRRAFADGEVDGMTLLPTPVQRPGPPLWVGGAGSRALRRAAELADAWDAPFTDPDALADGIARLHAACKAVGRDPATLDVAVRGLPVEAVDVDLVARYAALGVTELGVRPRFGDVDSLAALADRVGLNE